VLNLSVLLEDSARRYPNRDALVLGDTRLTYAQVNAAANQVANLLVERGIQPGDKVALSCPNLPYFPIVYFGILKAGAVVVPLNVLLKGREVAYHLADADVKAYFCFEGTADLAIGAEGYAGFQDLRRRPLLPDHRRPGRSQPDRGRRDHGRRAGRHAQHGASASVAYLGFIKTDMTANGFAGPIAERFEATLPKFLMKKLQPSEAGAAIVDGIERRAARIIAPKRWTAYSILCGVLNPVVDIRTERNAAIQTILRDADKIE